MRILGIDVGLTGAVAALNPAGEVMLVADLPVMVHGRTKWIDSVTLAKIVAKLGCDEHVTAFVEQTHALPKVAGTTAHSMGLTLGSTLAALQLTGCTIHLVTPMTWKREFNLLAPKQTDSQRKAASLCQARLLFPRVDLARVKDNGRAEAILIGEYGRRTLYQKAAA